MEKESSGSGHFHRTRQSMRQTLDLLHDRASSVLRFSLQWNDVEEHFGSAEKSIEQRAKEVEAMEESVSRRLREVEARERKLGSLHESINEKMVESDKKEKEFTKLSVHLDSVERCVDEKLKELGMKARVLLSVKKATDDRFNNIKVAVALEESVRHRLRDVEARERKLVSLHESINEKMVELDRKEKEFAKLSVHLDSVERCVDEKLKELGMKARVLLSVKKATDDRFNNIKVVVAMEESVRQRLRDVEVRENEVGMLQELIDAKSIEDKNREFELEETMEDEERFRLETMPRLEYDYSPNPPAKKLKTFGESDELIQGCESDGEKPPVQSNENLELSHSLDPSNNVVMYPNKGETWALFRDWGNQAEHKPPCKYDFVEVVSDFDDDFGVGVVYLGKVKGFVSVFEQAEQHGIAAMQVAPEEMQRFSHRVPSFRMTGKEKEGALPGTFELYPSALPNDIFELDPQTSTADVDMDMDREIKVRTLWYFPGVKTH